MGTDTNTASTSCTVTVHVTDSTNLLCNVVKLGGLHFPSQDQLADFYGLEKQTIACSKWVGCQTVRPTHAALALGCKVQTAGCWLCRGGKVMTSTGQSCAVRFEVVEINCGTSLQTVRSIMQMLSDYIWDYATL